MTGRRPVSTAAWLWLPPAVWAALVPALFYAGMRSDPPERRAGAEPVMSGIVFATPFLVLFLVAVLCALLAVISDSRRGRARSLGGMTVAAGLAAALVLGLSGLPAARDGATLRLVVTALLVTALLAPVVPAWASLRREAQPPSSGRPRRHVSRTNGTPGR